MKATVLKLKCEVKNSAWLPCKLKVQGLTPFPGVTMRTESHVSMILSGFAPNGAPAQIYLP